MFLYILSGGDTKLLEAATSALREALHKLAEVKCLVLEDIKDADLQVRMMRTKFFIVGVYLFIVRCRVPEIWLKYSRHVTVLNTDQCVVSIPGPPAPNAQVANLNE
jgi:hypothetical protein